jgi:Flp pilus assembly protein TadG
MRRILTLRRLSERWKRSLGGCHGRSRGQSLVELALMLPLIALILVGTVDLGRAFFAYMRLTNAVREGALYGMIYPAQIDANSVLGVSADPNNIVYQVQQESGDQKLTISSSDVLCYQERTTALKNGNGNCRQASPGDTIQVRATYEFTPITTQMMGIFGTNKFLMRKTVRMVIL